MNPIDAQEFQKIKKSKANNHDKLEIYEVYDMEYVDGKMSLHQMNTITKHIMLKRRL